MVILPPGAEIRVIGANLSRQARRKLERLTQARKKMLPKSQSPGI